MDLAEKERHLGSREVTTSNDLVFKLDPNGYPLRPQPSDDPKDPLNWNKLLKLWVLFQVSFLAFLGPFTQALINSAFLPLAKSLHITVVEAGYQTTVPIIFAGIAPIIWSPISNIYGRRPIFVIVSAIGVAAHCASAAAKTWTGILVARAFVGIGTSAGMGIGAAVVADMFFMHDRGRYMGIYVVFVTNGAHVAAIIGGYIAKYAGWRYCYWVGGIILGVTWLVILFGLPETLYHRSVPSQEGSKEDRHSQSARDVTWFDLLTFRGIQNNNRRLRIGDFTHVFYMLKYPSVLLPALYYSLSFGFGSVLFAVTGSAAFGTVYHFDTVGVGLCIGLSTFIGTLIGELSAGPVSDFLLLQYRRRHSGDPKAEVRLYAMWPGVFLLPIGVAIEGVCIQYKTHYMGPVMGIGIGAFGLQIVSTNIFAYITDCYKPQSSEISTLLNFGRQIFSFTLGFYCVPFAKATTWGIAWGVFAVIDFVFVAGIVALMFRGRQWRERLGLPNFDKDL